MPTDFDMQSLYATSSEQLTELTVRNTMFSWVSVVLGLVGMLVVLLYVVLWVYILVDVIRRDDLKENKLLWVLLLLFVAPIGMVVYGFVEGKRKLAWLSLSPIIILPLVLVLYSILSFVSING